MLVMFSSMKIISIERISPLLLYNLAVEEASFISMIVSIILLNLFSVSSVVTLKFACAIISRLLVISIFVEKQAR